MTRWPPPYPRVPHLLRTGATTRDDLVLTDAEVAGFLSQPVSVEEKVDGANVMLWLDAHRVEVATRAGPGAVDRAGQLGPLRAWAATRSDSLRVVLADGAVLYGEWLWLTHGVRYDRLPDWLLGLDVLRRDGSWLSVDERSAVFEAGGITLPPELYRGRLPGLEAIQPLLARSPLTEERSEGVIVRSLEPSPFSVRLAKVIASTFAPRGDAEWASGSVRNAVLAD